MKYESFFALNEAYRKAINHYRGILRGGYSYDFEQIKDIDSEALQTAFEIELESNLDILTEDTERYFKTIYYEGFALKAIDAKNLEQEYKEKKGINTREKAHADEAYSKLKGWLVDGLALTANQIRNKAWRDRGIDLIPFGQLDIQEHYNINGDYRVGIKPRPGQSSAVMTQREPIRNEDANVFCKSMPIKKALEHFKALTTVLNKHKRPFLTEEQFELFIRRAFIGEDLPKQIIDYGNREKLFIVKRFYQFYDLSWKEYENTSQCTEKYIRLLTDNFEGWKFENIAQNFGNKVNREW
jgi:hypothetical protein